MFFLDIIEEDEALSPELECEYLLDHNLIDDNQLSDEEPFDTSDLIVYSPQDQHNIAKNTLQNVPEPLTQKRRFGRPKPKPKLDVEEREFSRLLLTNLRKTDPAHRLTCEICDYRYFHRSGLLRHMIRFHNATASSSELNEKRFSCDICGIKMSMMHNLEKHKRIHTGDKPFACTFESCDRRFAGASEQKIHSRIHYSDRQFKCDQCSFAGNSTNQLNSHIRSRHNDNRLYPCEVCGHTFKRPKELDVHLGSHTGARNYDCYVCDRSFARPASLRMHMNIHTDSRPYKCSICERHFHNLSARRGHEKLVHKVL